MPADAEVVAVSIPEELKRLKQWVNWSPETRGTRLTKVPYCPATGRKASCRDRRTWASFTDALNALEAGRYDGIGFVFTADDPYTGIDLDNALDHQRKVKPWAQAILTRLPTGVYIEISPGGRGLHVIVRARKPGQQCRKAVQDGAVEIYDRDRYFTMTGNLLAERVSEIAEAQKAVDAVYHELFSEPQGSPKRLPAPTPSTLTDQEILQRARSGKHGARFQGLWDGDISGYPSHSEADLALCSHLWFWTGGDESRVDALFRQSGLMSRKWERADYRDTTIAKSGTGNKVYEPRAKSADRGNILKFQQRQEEKASEPPLSVTSADKPQRDNTHCANAWRIANRHHAELRYVEKMGFLVYDGRRWVLSETKALDVAMRVSRIICEEIADVSREAAQTTDEAQRKILQARAERLSKWAQQSEQGSAIRESLKLTAPMLLLDPQKLDSDPYLLNVENGTVDLRSGKLSKHSPKDFLTKLAPVQHDPTVDAPRWRSFIQEILGGCEPLVRYLQKALGYSITGLAREQCVFLAHGQGQNGKSTLLDALCATLGREYVIKAAPDLLMQTRHDRPHPAEIADLRGARIVISQEVASGKIFDAQKLKELTGERWLKARHMYGDWFSFEATFKLYLAANHLPRVGDSTFAFWRRIRLIPFTQTIANPDRELFSKLDAERSGILNWLLEGTRLYLAEGLELPPEMTQAVEDYRTDSDSLGQFITECCVTEKGHRVKALELWTAYEAYAEERNLSMIGRWELKAELLRRGFHQPPRKAGGIFYSGISLKKPTTGEREI